MFLKYVLRLLFHFVDETEYDEVIEANAELIEKTDIVLSYTTFDELEVISNEPNA